MAEEITLVKAEAFTAHVRKFVVSQSAFFASAQTYSVGEVITTRAEGFAYEVVASSAADTITHPVTGQILKVLPGPNGYNVKAFGAKGDGVTDDTAAILAAAAKCKGLTGETLLLEAGQYLFTSELDLREIRRIIGTGVLVTQMTGSVDYVTIGTSVNSNVNMDGADIQLFVRNTLNGGNNDNTGLEGTRGIVVRGSARGRYRLYSYNAERGVVLAPESGHYIAFSEFTIGTNGTRIGLDWKSEGTGWYNQNTFYHVDVYPQGNAIAGGTIGVQMDTGTPNNNVFLHLCPEGMDESMAVLTGLRNKFLNVRNESAGPARFGDGTSQATSGNFGPMGNVVEFIYNPQEVDWQCERPNIVMDGTRGGALWANQVRFSHLDFVKAGGLTGYTAIKATNSATGTPYFQYGVRDDTKRSFNPGSNNRIQYFVPVKKGDVFRVTHEVAAGGDSPKFALIAYGASLTQLPTLASGELCYIGTTATTNASGTSQTSARVDMNNTAFAMPLLVSVNRGDVAFIGFELFPGVENVGFTVDKLLSGRNAEIENRNAVVGLADLSSGSLAAGQIALGDYGRVGIGGGKDSIVQIGQVPAQGYGGDFSNAASGLNTKHKVKGLMAHDLTNNRVMIARGSAATDPWDVVDGSASVTPS